MCGIIAVVRRPSDRRPPEPGELTEPLAEAKRALAAAGDDLADSVTAAAVLVEQVDGLLRGTPGVRALLGRGALLDEVASCIDDVEAELARIDGEAERLSGSALEAVNAA